MGCGPIARLPKLLRMALVTPEETARRGRALEFDGRLG